MKKLIAVFLFIHICSVAYNQIVKGSIKDKKTRSKIGFASIHVSGTFVGVNSDQDGKFVLDISKYASMPITISAIGYYSVTLTDFSTDEPIIIYLTPKLYELKEVVISAKSLASKRKQNLKIFKHEFLGTTANSLKCKILNEGDITFNYDSDKDTLKAYASKPILIDNRALGYTIIYYLDKFEYYRKNNSLFFDGSIFFKKDLTLEETQNQAFERRRKQAYLGSRMHFFRVLWENDLDSSGFMINNSSYDSLKFQDIVIQENKKKFLRYPESIYINYYTQSSDVAFLKNQVYFNKNGYFDPRGLIWQGDMALYRLADQLPFEYILK
jgi:hypothetical protein